MISQSPLLPPAFGNIAAVAQILQIGLRNVFGGLASGSYTVYVRDKNGCGIVEESIVQDLTLEGFPNFFSPNGDGINDEFFIPFSPSMQKIELLQVS